MSEFLGYLILLFSLWYSGYIYGVGVKNERK